MAKVTLLEDSERELSWCFYCPGCRCGHFFRIRSQTPGDALWQWNNDVEQPTVKPSIAVFRDDPTRRCHLIITDGMIHYQQDCHHNLRGCVIVMEEDD